MNNPLNATDPLGLQSASENDQCSPNSARPIDGGIPRDPGLECGTGALDSSDPGDAPQCSTDPDAPCITIHKTAYGPAEDPLDQAELIASISEMLNHMAIFQQLVNGTWHASDSRFWNVTKAFFTNFSLKPTGEAGKYGNCLENNRMDNAVRSLATAYGHPQLGNALANATLAGAGASALNAGANYTFGANVPGLFGLSEHSSTWLRTLGYRTAGRAISAAGAVMLVGEGAYDATAIIRCAISD